MAWFSTKQNIYRHVNAALLHKVAAFSSAIQTGMGRLVMLEWSIKWSTRIKSLLVKTGIVRSSGWADGKHCAGRLGQDKHVHNQLSIQ